MGPREKLLQTSSRVFKTKALNAGTIHGFVLWPTLEMNIAFSLGKSRVREIAERKDTKLSKCFIRQHGTASRYKVPLASMTECSFLSFASYSNSWAWGYSYISMVHTTGAHGGREIFSFIEQMMPQKNL